MPHGVPTGSRLYNLEKDFHLWKQQGSQSGHLSEYWQISAGYATPAEGSGEGTSSSSLTLLKATLRKYSEIRQQQQEQHKKDCILRWWGEKMTLH